MFRVGDEGIAIETFGELTAESATKIDEALKHGRGRYNMEALRAALAEFGRRGLLGLRIPREFDGLEVGPIDFRRFQESSQKQSPGTAG